MIEFVITVGWLLLGWLVACLAVFVPVDEREARGWQEQKSEEFLRRKEVR